MPTHHVPRQSMTRMIFVLPPLRRILMNGGQGGNVFPACQRIVKADDLHILRDADPLSRQVRVCERSAAMKAPVELLSDRAVLRSKMEGLCPDKLGSRCTECRQCKEKHGFPAGVQKSAELQKMENPTRNLTILRWILVRSRELESLAL